MIASALDPEKYGGWDGFDGRSAQRGIENGGPVPKIG
jgi:hypothetical protein